jgi:4-hydroxyproline epimerase
MSAGRAGSERFFPERIVVVDSHTEGEPTRVVVEGWPELEAPTPAGAVEELRSRWDHLRSGVVCEPRGHDALVGALLLPPVTEAAAGVVFFNNVGYLGMCGHGLMGVVRTLSHLGRLTPGEAAFETPAGRVGARLEADGSVTIRNAPAFCHREGVRVHVPGLGPVEGNVAWGGNWFFLTSVAEPSLDLAHVGALRDATRRILAALREAGVTGKEGAEIDHVELTGPPSGHGADAANFVLCPGGAYDRSPCGTGTSAQLAVLHRQGRIAPGEPWTVESVTGGRFTGWLEEHDGRLHPMVRGRAWITGTAELRFDPADPMRAGFTAQ